MSIEALKTFLAAAEHGSFAAAAQAVRRTQSAVSMQMRQLERQFGVTLFDRRTRPLVLSAEGRALVPAVTEVVRRYETLGRGAPGDVAAAGTFRLGAVPSMVTGQLPKALVALAARHPAVHVEVVMGQSAALVALVAKGELDAAIVSELGRTPKGLTWRPLLREPLVVVAPKEATALPARDLLTRYPFIRYSRNTWVGALIERVLKERGIAVRDAMTLDTLEAVVAMVSHGLGVAVVPLQVGRTHLPDTVRIVPLTRPTVFRSIGLVTRDGDGDDTLPAAIAEELGRSPASRRRLQSD